MGFHAGCESERQKVEIGKDQEGSSPARLPDEECANGQKMVLASLRDERAVGLRAEMQEP